MHKGYERASVKLDLVVPRRWKVRKILGIDPPVQGPQLILRRRSTGSARCFRLSDRLSLHKHPKQADVCSP